MTFDLDRDVRVSIIVSRSRTGAGRRRSAGGGGLSRRGVLTSIFFFFGTGVAWKRRYFKNDVLGLPRVVLVLEGNSTIVMQVEADAVDQPAPGRGSVSFFPGEHEGITKGGNFLVI
jgi:hypothetical protein